MWGRGADARLGFRIWAVLPRSLVPAWTVCDPREDEGDGQVGIDLKLVRRKGRSGLGSAVMVDVVGEVGLFGKFVVCDWRKEWVSFLNLGRVDRGLPWNRWRFLFVVRNAIARLASMEIHA